MKNTKFFDIREISDLKEMIVTNGELFSDKPAFLYKKERGGEYFEITHKKFREDVDALGTKLIDMGLKGKKIAVMGANCYQWILTYFATVNGTGTIVPIDKELEEESVFNILKKAKCDAIFYTDEYEELFAKYKDVKWKIKMTVYHDEADKSEKTHIDNFIASGYELLKEGKRDFVDAVIDVNAVAAILFTSGTTGDPKGAMISHKNIVTVIHDTGRVEDFKSERTLSILPIHHTFECTVIMVILHQGGSVAFFEGLKYVVKNMQESKASMLVAVPLIVESVYNKIWAQAKKTGKDKKLQTGIKLSNSLKKIGIDKSRTLFKDIYANFGGELKMFLCGAASLNPNVAKGLMDLGFGVYQGYGLTECTPLITATYMFDDIYKHTGSCGKVVPSGELKIINKDESGIGEICYKGDNVMSGYYEMPEETKKVLEDGWFSTGDLGFVDKDGWLYITGRQKNVIVTRTGKNIYPEELEAKINKMQYVTDSMVYSVEEGDGDTKIWVQIFPDYEKLNEEQGIDLNDENATSISKDNRKKQVFKLFNEQIKDLNESIASYKRIKNIVIREEDFIRTTTKKIKRKESMKEYQ